MYRVVKWDSKMKSVYIILGNGFSIDFLQHYALKDASIVNKIDVQNLFRLGDKISPPWDTKPGFLSYKSCPSLWLLGARPSNSVEESTALIEEIITCANMFFDFVNEPEQKAKRLELANQGKERLYLKAYCELIVYLRQLFSCYNESITDRELKDFIDVTDWGWVTFLRNIRTWSHGKVTIVTYNYDVWLERILKILNIPFFIGGFETFQENAVEIIKPHGSISFVPKDSVRSLYTINYNLDFDGIAIEQLNLCYENLSVYEKGAIIPPAGDSSRLEVTAPWSHILRRRASGLARETTENDEVLLCGMSYWHVDRKEVDELLINLNQDVGFTFINPKPPRDLNAVLISIFRNYVQQSSSSHIGGILNG